MDKHGLCFYGTALFSNSRIFEVPMKKENLAVIEMLTCAALWSIAGIFMKLIPWNGFAVAGMRSLIAGITIALYMILKHYRFVFNRQTFVSGVFAGLTYTCFTVANKLTTAANAIVLQFTSPVFIVVFSALFLKTRIRKADLTVVLLTLAGIALFFFDQLKPGYVAGNFVAIGAGMFMAGMYMTIGEMQGQERFSAIVIAQFLTLLIGLPFILTTHPTFNGTTVSCILILGVFQLGISYILYVKASRYCPPLACCLLGAVEPLLNPVWVMIFDGEKPGPFALVGGLIVIVAITAWCVWDGKQKEAQQPA